MSSDPEVDRCLALIREVTDALCAEVESMSPATWDAPTNCPPWKVRQLVAHVVTSGEGFRQSVERGLAGTAEPPPSRGDRDKEIADVAASEPPVLAEALRRVRDGFETLYADLDETDLETICWHRRGNRSARWYAAHRLAEVAFHRWDLQASLGQAPSLDERVAALLLPTLLESNAPRTYAAGLSPERGSGECYVLAVNGDPGSRWLVQIHPDRFDITRGGGEGEASIGGAAADLALLVYGRADLESSRRAGRLRTEGDAAALERFPRIFPRP